MRRIAVIGTTGYAIQHFRSIDILEKEKLLKLSAVVAWKDKNSEKRKELEARNILIVESFEELLSLENQFDIISIPTGIMLHESMAVASLKAGYHVLCEKPLAGDIKQAMQICDAVEKSGKICVVGYQNLYSESIQKIRRISIKKELGCLISACTLAKWPRSQSYYERNNWAGKIEFEGKKIYDSIAQNACAHFLQNMLFVAGETFHFSDDIKSVYGENYRAKNIESADTQFIKVKMKNQTEITFIGSHCVMEQFGPNTEYKFENGRILWSFGGDTIVFDANGNKIQHFDNEGADIKTLPFRDLLQCIEFGNQPKCTPQNTIQQTIVVENAFRSSGGVYKIPDQYRETKFLKKTFYSGIKLKEPDPNVIIIGIDDACEKAFKSRKSFTELGLPWAKAGECISELIF